MALAPSEAAILTAAPRLLIEELFASTRRILQLGQAALTISRSSAISPAQPVFVEGSGLSVPLWFTFLKQPLAVVHGGRPNLARYTARSLSAFGSSYASTMATVMPAPPEGMLYAF